jgi:DNA-binding NarL/FixJ family response regulator
VYTRCISGVPECLKDRHFARRVCSTGSLDIRPALARHDFSQGQHAVALISRRKATSRLLRSIAQAHGWTLEIFSTPHAALHIWNVPPQLAAGNRQSAIGNQPSPPPRFDLAIIDVCRPGSDRACGFKLAEELTAALPGERILIRVPSCSCDHCAFHCALAGAIGYLVEPVSRDQLVEAATSALRGEPRICSKGLEALLSSLRALGHAHHSGALTRRELDILVLSAQGLCNKQIGEKLDLSEHTVHAHLAHTYKKLHAHSRTEALRKLVRGGQKLSASNFRWALPIALF